MDSVLGTAEGCHIIKRDGWYYLFTAEGGTQDGHQEWVYRSDKPLGPWVAPPVHINPIVFNGNHPHIQNTGHLDMVEGENGQWWAVFLGVRPQFRADQLVNPILMRSALGRESFMAPVEWVDGWPVVNGQRPIELVGEANVGSVSYVPAADWVDEFKTTSESPLQKHGSAISQRRVRRADIPSHLASLATRLVHNPYPLTSLPLPHRPPRLPLHPRFSLPDRLPGIPLRVAS